jgi:putative transposase
MTLDLMVVIDKQVLETPSCGVQQMSWHLRNKGHAVNGKRIRRLMPIYRKPDTGKPATGQETCPDLLGSLQVERPNQVWRADLTCLPRRRGFPCLVAIKDWHTRKVLAWRSANTPEADFRGDALNEAIQMFGPPEIMNMDHGRANGSIRQATSGQPVHILCLD